MTLSDVGVPGQHIDVLRGGDVHPDGRLLSVAEIQQAYRDLIGRRWQGGACEPATVVSRTASSPPHMSSAPANTAPHTWPEPASSTPHTSPEPASSTPHTSPEPAENPAAEPTDTDALGRDWVAVVSAHSGAGASCVALAIADALDAAGCPCRLIEAAHPARSGLVAAATAELGNDPTGAWRRGSRRLTTLYRRATATAPLGWPDPILDAATIVDLGLPVPANIARLVGDRPCVVLVCRVTVPGLRLAERLLADLAGNTSIVLAAVGPSRWPGEVAASIGPRVLELRDGHRVVAVPDDRHLQVSGPTNSPLPKSVSAAGRELLGLIGAARSGSAGAPPNLTARSASRKRGKTR